MKTNNLYLHCKQKVYSRLANRKETDIVLHFIGGATAEAKITKEGRKYTYFTAGSFNIKYRLNKETNQVEVAPYWRKEPKMYVTD